MGDEGPQQGCTEERISGIRRKIVNIKIESNEKQSKGNEVKVKKKLKRNNKDTKIIKF
jgi:hypothetical protein